MDNRNKFTIIIEKNLDPLKVIGGDITINEKVNGKILNYDSDTGIISFFLDKDGEKFLNKHLLKEVVGISSRAFQKPSISKIDRIKKQLNKLTDEERIEIFSNYCTYCGTKILLCNCVNNN